MMFTGVHDRVKTVNIGMAVPAATVLWSKERQFMLITVGHLRLSRLNRIKLPIFLRQASSRSSVCVNDGQNPETPQRNRQKYSLGLAS